MQKGPEYFVKAAKRVLEKEKDVVFVVAGSGDMEGQMIEQAAALGISDKILFTGFIRGKDWIKAYQMADLCVMPSVSEPFGLVPLESMVYGTPVLISNQSGVSEIVNHALKVNFWDIDEMANKIIAVIKYSELGKTLKKHGHTEVKNMSWQDTAKKCIRVYNNLTS